MRILARALTALAFIATLLGVGATPAAACSCAVGTDTEHFEWADVVFVGELISYEFDADPDGDGIQSSMDPAVWTFAVEEVFKGTATETQPVLSAVDGASCGLEIPHDGTFLVFADHTTGDGPFDYPEGNLQAGLCGGTREWTGSIDVDVTSSPPDPDPEEAGPAVLPTENDDATDYTLAIVVGIGAAAVLGLVLVLLRRRARAS